MGYQKTPRKNQVEDTGQLIAQLLSIALTSTLRYDQYRLWSSCFLPEPSYHVPTNFIVQNTTTLF